MPAARAQGGGGSRRRKTTTRGPQGLPTVRTPVARPQVTPRRPSPAFGPISSQAKPFAPAQRKAAKRAQRARHRLPSDPTLKRPPLIAPQNMTAAQRQAVVRQGKAAIDRARNRGGHRSVTEYYEQASARDRRIIDHIARVSEYERHRLAGDITQRGPQGLPTAGVPAAPSFASRIQRPLIAGPKRTHTVGIGPATITVNPHAALATLAGLTSLSRANDPASRFVKRSLSDVGTLGTAPFVGGYEALAGAYEGIRDNPLTLAGGPLAPLLGLASSKRGQELAKGIVKGTAHEIAHPIQSFQQHPLLTALDAAGGVGVLGRGAGAVARGVGSTAESAGIRGALARAGSTVRSPLALTEEAAGPVVERTASKDLIRKGFQSVRDSYREPLRDGAGNVVYRMDRGRRVPVLKASEREADRHLRRVGDHVAARGNDVERMQREKANRDSKVARRSRKAKGDRAARSKVRGKDARDLVSMVQEGSITSAKHFVEDLTAQRDRLKAEYKRRTTDEKGYRHTGEAEAAQNRIKQIDAALKDPKVLRQASAIVAEGERLGRHANTVEDRLLASGVLSSSERARGAGLAVTKIEHMGGRHFTEAEHARLEAQARKVEDAARAAYESAPDGEKAAAKKAWHDARDRRIAVSGRAPDKVRHHEKLSETAAEARKAHQDAQAKVARLKAKRSRMVGRHEVHRGQEAYRSPVRAYYVGEHRFETRAEADAFAKANGGKVEVVARSMAEARRNGEMAQLDRQIERAVKQAEAAGNTARKARHEVRQNPMPKRNAGIRNADGTFLSHKDAEDFLRSRGRDPRSVSYLPHREDVRGRKAHHSQLRPGTRPVMDKPGVRTGELYRKGATESSTDLIHDHGVRQAVQLAKAEQLDHLVAESGIRHPAWAKAQRGEQLTDHERRVVDKGGYFNGKEAEELAQRIEYDTSGRPVLIMRNGQRMVPMRAFAARLSEQTQAIIRDDLQAPGAMDSLPQRLLDDRILTQGEIGKSTARNVVLVPGTLIDRLEAHLRPAGEIEKLLQALNKPFRAAVLPQPRWLTGNFVEPYLVRLPGVGSGAVNVFGLGLDISASVRGLRRMAKSSDPAVRRAAEEMRAQQLGGLLIGARGASNRRALMESKAYRSLVAKAPVMRTIGDMGGVLGRVLMGPANGFFHLNRVAIEQWAQHASIGRDLRKDIQNFTGSWLQTVRLSEKALDEATRGLVNTSTQHRFMKAQHELLGKYGGYSPRLRAIVQGPMPFLPWSLNAARFVLWTMPMHRTTQTALLIKTQQVVAQDWANEHSDAFADMALSNRTKKGGYVDASRYTPYGLTGPIVAGDLSGVANQVVPVLSGPLAALQGKDAFGRDLKVKPTADNPSGKPTLKDLVGILAWSTAESVTPYLSMTRRMREGGGTGYSNSNVVFPKVKPNTKYMSAARRTFDPFRPVYLRPPSNGGRAGPHTKGDKLLLRAAERSTSGALSDEQMRLLEEAAIRASSP